MRYIPFLFLPMICFADMDDSYFLYDIDGHRFQVSIRHDRDCPCNWILADDGGHKEDYGNK